MAPRARAHGPLRAARVAWHCRRAGAVSSRIQPRAHYLRTYHEIDIGLDTFPYNGHTTSLDAFWMGVPVATAIGKTPAARAGYSLLSNLGLSELAAANEQGFIEDGGGAFVEPAAFARASRGIASAHA